MYMYKVDIMVPLVNIPMLDTKTRLYVTNIARG